MENENNVINSVEDNSELNSQPEVEESIKEPRKNIFSRIWEGVKWVARQVVGLVEAGIARILYGNKAAVQDLQKISEMMESPISTQKNKNENKEVKNEAPEKEIEKEEPEKEEVEENLNREVTDKDTLCQEFFDENIENERPFKELIESMGFEWENNPDKVGVITLKKTNLELEKTLKVDLELKDFIKKEIDFNKLHTIFENKNSTRIFDENHNPKTTHIIDTNELRINVAILAAGINQLYNKKNISFEFEAYNQPIKMEVSHTEENDFAKIITSDGNECVAFKPEGQKFFWIMPNNRVQETIRDNCLAIEALNAIEEEVETSKINQIIENSKVVSAEVNAWDKQLDKILNDGIAEQKDINSEMQEQSINIEIDEEEFDSDAPTERLDQQEHDFDDDMLI